MLLNREIDVAERMSTVPELNRALGLALSGELQRARHMVNDYIRDDPDSDVALFAQREMVGMIGATGELEQAVKLAAECSKKAIALWGMIDEKTIIIRNTEMYWTGKVGWQKKAETLADQLMADAQTALGRTDQLTFAVRNNSARIFEDGKTPERARKLYLELLADFDSSEDPVSDEALTTRHNYADYLMAQEEYQAAREVYQRLLLQITEVSGTRSEEALVVRHESAQLAMIVGDAESAKEQWQTLSQDCRKALGLSHQLTASVLNHLVAAHARDEEYQPVVKWLGLLIQALRDTIDPESLGELMRMKNRYGELATEARAD